MQKARDLDLVLSESKWETEYRDLSVPVYAKRNSSVRVDDRNG